MLINIQFLRFAAAVLVVIYHAGAHVLDAGAERTGLFALGEAIGFAGVDVFFVISGFIMFHTTRTLAGSAAGNQFLRRRFARIYSGYWPFFLLAWGLFYWIDPARLAQVDMLESATLWPGRELLIPISWTLTFEMYFYLAFTLLLLVDVRQRLWLLVAALATVITWNIWAQGIQRAYDPGNLETISIAGYYLASPYLGEFIAGALVAWWLERTPARHGGRYLLAGIALFLFSGWINTSQYGSAIEQGYTIVPRVLWFGSASVLILAGLVRLEQQGKVAPERFSLATGGASYAIYLSHILVLALTRHLGLNRALQDQQQMVVTAVFTALVSLIVFLSVLHYRYLERPLHRQFKRWLRVSAPGKPEN